MLDTNLATRPFYNERGVRVWLTMLAILVVATTAFNLSQWARHSKSDTEEAGRAARDEASAASMSAEATRLRASVNVAQVEAISRDAAEANELIDRRTFSWTELFNRFEATIPADVRITSVRQRIDRVRGSVLTVSVLARDVGDINQFLENLEDSGAFTAVLAQDLTRNESGDLEGILETEYRPGETSPPAPAAVATRTAGVEAKR